MNAVKSKKGFTLIELLVVIAIIALLLAILTPALNKVKEIAKTIICRTNVRSLVLGFRLYAETNDGKVFGYGSEGKHNLWLLQMEDHVGDIDKVRYCPTTKLNPATGYSEGSAKLTWVWPFDVDEPEHGSYGFNGHLYFEPGRSSSWNDANPTNSASIPLFADCMWVDSWPSDGDTCSAGLDLNEGSMGPMMSRFLINRHGDKINVGFMDNHQESVKLEMLWSLKWSKQFQTKGVMTRTDGSPIYIRSN